MNALVSQCLPVKPVLIVDDEASMRTALTASFGQRGWQVECASGKSEAVSCLRRRKHALVVSDVRMADGDGFEVLHAARQISPATPVILLTAFGTVPAAVEAMKSGACEYLTKPVAFDQLLEAAGRIMSRVGSSPDCEPGIIGSSPALLYSLEQARKAAASDADVLIEAESGTGKELLARRIHFLSARRENRFVAVNCAALPESLLESELFGHARGAFTGAIEACPGKLHMAQRGTLLLDEIGEMPLALQPKLLRVLQEREFYPLGDNRPVKLDVRVIATTNRSLTQLVRAGKFRADLYYRLNVISLSLPPLRERREDIRHLSEHFASRFSPGSCLSKEFVSRLEQHVWPGNIRELANVIRRALALGEAEVGTESRSRSSEWAHIPSVSFQASLADNAMQLRPGLALDAVERRLIELTLAATSGNRSRAAEMLGVSLRTVRNKVREYNLPARRDYVHD